MWLPHDLSVTLETDDLSEIAAALVGIGETEQLELKRGQWWDNHASTAAGQVKIAERIASFANARGGMIAIGFAEGTTELHPTSARGDLDQRVRQITAQLISPVPSLTILERPTGAGTTGFVSVPPSPGSPHAVNDPKTGERTLYSFPVRRGKHTHYLREYEIAARYAGRGDARLAAQAELARIQQRMLSLPTACPPPTVPRHTLSQATEPPTASFRIAAAPTSPGPPQSIDELQTTARDLVRSVGARALRPPQYLPPESEPPSNHAIVRSGAARAATFENIAVTAAILSGGSSSIGLDLATNRVNDESALWINRLFEGLAVAYTIAVEHARSAGAGGQLLTSSNLQAVRLRSWRGGGITRRPILADMEDEVDIGGATGEAAWALLRRQMIEAASSAGAPEAARIDAVGGFDADDFGDPELRLVAEALGFPTRVQPE